MMERFARSSVVSAKDAVRVGWATSILLYEGFVLAVVAMLWECVLLGFFLPWFALLDLDCRERVLRSIIYCMVQCVTN